MVVAWSLQVALEDGLKVACTKPEGGFRSKMNGRRPKKLVLVGRQDFFNLNFEVVQIRSEVFQVANRINLTAKLKNAYSLDLI